MIEIMRTLSNYMWAGLLIALGFFSLAELVVMRRARDVILVIAFWLLAPLFILRAASALEPPLLAPEFVTAAAAVLWFCTSLLFLAWTILFLWQRRKVDRAQLRLEARERDHSNETESDNDK